MESENKGYTLAISSASGREQHSKVYLKPMALYVPEAAQAAVSGLAEQFSPASDAGKAFQLTVTNNNNGVSVDKAFSSMGALLAPDAAVDAVKDLINIVRGYDSDEESNVCGW